MHVLRWYVMQTLVVRADGGPGARVARALGSDLKGKASPILYLLGIGLASLVATDGSAAAWLPMGVFVAVAAMWLVPDRRLEHAVTEDSPARYEQG